MQFPPKRPNEILDYKLDWSHLLDGDVIATSSTAVSGTGLVKVTEAKDDTSSTVWLRAGEPGREYRLTCKITTIGGRTFEQVTTLPIIGT